MEGDREEKQEGEAAVENERLILREEEERGLKGVGEMKDQR